MQGIDIQLDERLKYHITYKTTIQLELPLYIPKNNKLIANLFSQRNTGPDGEFSTKTKNNK